MDEPKLAKIEFTIPWDERLAIVNKLIDAGVGPIMVTSALVLDGNMPQQDATTPSEVPPSFGTERTPGPRNPADSAR